MKEKIKKIIELQDEINFKELFRSPARLFGYNYFYILIVLVAIGIHSIKNLQTVNKNSVVPVVKPDTTQIQDLQFSLPVNLSPVDVFQVAKPTPDLVERGKNFYNSNCSSCHGESGKGDGAAGAFMNPKPRDFTNPEGWVNGRKISQMYKTLQEGIIKSGMPAFNHINPEELFAVIHYIRNFAKDFPEDSKEDLQALNEAYKLSEGKKTSGQIPTSKASFLILTEASAEGTLYTKILNSISSNPGTEFDNFINSKVKFSVFLSKMISNNVNKAEALNYIKSNPISYGINPGFLLQGKDFQMNFLDRFYSLFSKKENKL